MRNHLFLFVIILLGCKSESKSNEIIVFEYVLGEKKTEALDLLLSDFESNLNKVYPKLSIQKAYEQYLKDLINPKTKDWDKFRFKSKETINKYLSSGLRDEIYTDHLVYDENTKDSLKSVKFNRFGKYMHGLYTVKGSDSVISKYYDKKEAAGM